MVDGPSSRAALRDDLTAARDEFRSLVRTFSDTEMIRPSLNPGWTNGEILAHMLFGFMIVNNLLFLVRLFGRLPQAWSRSFARLLDAATGPFNWFNALGARMQARVFTRERIASRLERVFAALLSAVDTIDDREWARGMYYPVRWDPGFEAFMTPEKLFRYPVRHFHLHLHQLAR